MANGKARVPAPAHVPCRDRGYMRSARPVRRPSVGFARPSPRQRIQVLVDMASGEDRPSRAGRAWPPGAAPYRGHPRRKLRRALRLGMALHRRGDGLGRICSGRRPFCQVARVGHGLTIGERLREGGKIQGNGRYRLLGQEAGFVASHGF